MATSADRDVSAVPKLVETACCLPKGMRLWDCVLRKHSANESWGKTWCNFTVFTYDSKHTLVLGSLDFLSFKMKSRILQGKILSGQMLQETIFLLICCGERYNMCWHCLVESISWPSLGRQREVLLFCEFRSLSALRMLDASFSSLHPFFCSPYLSLYIDAFPGVLSWRSPFIEFLISTDIALPSDIICLSYASGSCNKSR